MHYHPTAINLKGERVLVLGALNDIAPEIERLLDSQARLTLVSQIVPDDIAVLLPVYGERLEIVKQNTVDYLRSLPPAGQSDPQNSYKLAVIFKLAAGKTKGDLAELYSLLGRAGIAVFDTNEPCVLKRGHLKIAVFSDGLLKPLEKAIMAKIEEALLVDLDHYAHLLDDVADLQDTVEGRDPQTWRTIKDDLASSEQIFQAIDRCNFKEAQKLINEFDPKSFGQEH